MGNVWDGVTKYKLRDEFKLCNVYSRKTVGAKLYCSGGCAVIAIIHKEALMVYMNMVVKLFRKE